MSWQRICAVAEFPKDGMVQCTTDKGHDVLVLGYASERFACQAICPHLDTPLAEGMFDGSTLTCHLHLWQWDIESGEPKGLAELPLQTYEVKEESGYLYVNLDT
jgi:toluene monooxygenase system ferredoxin subunit